MRSSSALYAPNFYPRPPRGGRPGVVCSSSTLMIFLSTPSARRATQIERVLHFLDTFLSTPSARRATQNRPGWSTASGFLSTPSARRATFTFSLLPRSQEISIHALREEGDILILRVRLFFFYFYPRPPRGGRHLMVAMRAKAERFLSTPSARRATCFSSSSHTDQSFLSTPSARRATRAVLLSCGRSCNFYPRPPRGGRLADSAENQSEH